MYKEKEVVCEGLEKFRRLRQKYSQELDRSYVERERILKQYWESVRRLRFQRERRPAMPSLPGLPPFPEECRGLICGAKTRAGSPCQRRDLYNGYRCRLHGGLSTGPKTKNGKLISSRNGLRPKKKRTP